MRIKLPILVFLLLVSSGLAFGQSVQVSGRVLDAEGGVPLAGAHVKLSAVSDALLPRAAYAPTSYRTVSDLNGSFSIDISPGVYTVSITYVGFESYSARETILESVSLTIRMTPRLIEINPLTITASRRPEKLLDAPAAITVLGTEEIESRTALTAASYLESVPGVDLIRTGLNSSRIVVRGFNDNLASSLLTLVDNRIAQAPSVRLTALQLIPISNGDIDQIEVVSGPASALYGPNAANGVVHIVTKSPFESRGTEVSVASGERDVRLGSFRHAGTYGRKIGYKFSLQYYTGSDFPYNDPVELSERSSALQTGASADTLRIGDRNFDVKNLGFNGRVDFRFRPDLQLILNGGITVGDNLEITPTGAAQVRGASVGYAQARLLYKDLFVQGYGNFLNSGDSFFLRTGEVFKDKSKLIVFQAQHHYAFGPRQRFTYGTDLFYTIPDGEGTVTGRNENRDQIMEFGGYLQSETTLSPRLNLIGAARMDYHDRLDTWTFSPRAAIVFKPAPSQNFRLTYNLAFKTPIANDLFSDVLGLRDVFQLGRMAPLIGFAPTTDLRVQGMIDGFSFQDSPGGKTRFRSPFAPLAGLSRSDYIELNDPAFTNVMWDVARQSTIAGLADSFVDSGLLTSEQAASVSSALDSVLPQSVEGVDNALKLLDLDSQQFFPVEGPKNFKKLEVTSTRTFELGYKGVVARALMVGIDVYHTRVRNFLGPFQVGTPNVFLETSTLFSYLNEKLTAALNDPANAEARTALAPLDNIPILGNGDGSPASEVATIISTGIASAIPFGTVSPTEAFDPTGVILMRRNFGDISVSGLDLNFMMFFSRRLRVGGMYSYVSDNFFRNVDGIDDIALNSPRHKVGGSVSYQTRDERLRLNLRGRYIEGYPVNSDVYVGRVDGFTVFDATIDYRTPFSRNTRINLTIQNLTDNKHREFVFVPELGRLAMLRLTHKF